jgi:uncharacterized protein YkwD
LICSPPTWGLNGYAELTWAFVNQYLISAYTISGFQGPAVSPQGTTGPGQLTSTPQGPTATPSPAQPTAPVAGTQLVVSPASAAPGAQLTISGSGFGVGVIDIYWKGSLFAQVYSANGTFAVGANLSPSAVPGPRTVSATNTSTGQQASTIFTVTGAGPTVTATSAAATAAATETPIPPGPTPPSGIPSSGTTSNGCQITSVSAQAEAQLLSLLNQHRAAAGAAPLTLNSSLSLISRAHSCDMYLHQQLNHTGSDGSSPFQRMAAGGFGMPPYRQEGENIGQATGYSPADAVSAIDSQMMAEPLSYGNHHWNIVNSGYSILGIGIIVVNGQTWLTEDFAG